GILLVNKPVGKTSHDIVYEQRKELQTRKIGHAGALDPYASGLLIILVGKATKLSDSFLNLDKTYEADILFGVETDSGDLEGKVINIKDKISNIKNTDLQIALNKFSPSYMQYVPVYSSVNVDGKKLRKLAREYDSF